jgi:cysteine desulfurase
VETARRQVANLINADPREIVWTSGATESDNLAIKGAVAGRDAPHVITSMIEHKAVLDVCGVLQDEGVKVTWLKPDACGRIHVGQVVEALTPKTVLVSLMLVNNELGSISDIAAIGAQLRGRGVLFHVDAAQAPGKIPVDVKALSADLLSLSAHKVYGPKGIGALYVRRSPDVRIQAQIHGGGHERGMRSGTLPAHQIVGMGKAFELAADNLFSDSARLEQLRGRFLGALAELEGVSLNGSLNGSESTDDAKLRVPGIINLSFAGVDAETLMLGLRELAVSSGSACSSATLDPSYVLRGIGLDDKQAHRALRFSFGRYTSGEEVDFAAAHIIDIVGRLRSAR